MTETGRDISDFTTLDSFLEEEGIREEVTIAATKRVVAMQLEMAMRDQHISKTAMATKMGTSRAQLDRVLDPAAFNVTLETLARAASIVGHRLDITLVKSVT
jgi:antitoxin HicB